MAWLGNWKQRIKLTVDSSIIDSNLTHYPVMVKIENSAVFTELGTNDKKIAFTKSDGTTQLYAEIELWDNTNNLAVLHVSKSDWVISSSSDTVFYMYFDSSKSDNTTYIGDIASATNVYDSNFVMVQHMGTSLLDSTSNENNGTNYGSTVVDGLNGKARSFDGVNDYINVADNNNFDIQNFTLMALTKFDSFPTFNTYQTSFILTRDLLDNSDGFYGIYEANSLLSVKAVTSTDNKSNNVGNLSTSVYYNLNGVKDGTNIYTFLNDTISSKTTVNGTMSTISDVFRIGYRTTTTYQYYLDGTIDEVRISNIARSDAWVKADDYNLRQNTLITQTYQSYIPDYKYKREIVIDHTKVDSTLTDYPVMVKLDDSNFNFDEIENPNGYDLIFEQDGYQLDHEVELFEPEENRYLYIDSNSKLEFTDSEDFNFINGDYTVEATLILSTNNIILSQWMGDNSAYIFNIYENNGDFICVVNHYNSPTTINVFNITLSNANIDDIVEFCVTRQGNIGYAFINGALISTFSHTQTYTNSEYDVAIGGFHDRVGYNTKIKRIKVNKGECKYITDYVIPSNYILDVNTILCINFKDENIGATSFTDLTGKTIKYTGTPIIEGQLPQALYHVKLPTISSTANTTFNILYGNENILADQSNANSTWDEHFVMIQHMGDSLVDSSGNNNNGTNYGSTVVDGLNGKSRSFDGVNDYISVPSSDGLNFGSSDFTVQLLNIRTAITSGKSLLSKTYASSNYGTGYLFGYGGTLGEEKIYLSSNSSGTDWNILSGGIMSSPILNFYRLTTIKRTSSALEDFQNDVRNSIATISGTIYQNTANLLIGNWAPNGTYDRGAIGFYDEVRISNIARSDAWIKADDYNLRLATLLSVGSEQLAGQITLMLGFNF